MKLRGIFIAVAVLGVGFLFITSCKKNTDCTANIICNDSTGVGMSGATVYLFANVKASNGGTITADLRATGVTDGSGRVSFTFKLPAIYDVKALKTAGTASMQGISIIKLEEGKAVEKTVVVR
jgi:hypothetical protein